MIQANEISKEYGDVRALAGASFEIGAGEVVGLLGPNGAGKTTLMKILTGYLHPSAGAASIDGIDVVADPLAVQKKIGYLPENAPLYTDMVVQEYLKMMAELREIPETHHVGLISDAVERTGLKDHLVRPIGQLSKGYRQRVGLAQAILHNPSVLILDEPSSGLDPTQIAEIRNLIKELAQNATVLLSTHILSEVEITCERVLIINEGELSADARLEDLRTNESAFVRVEGTADDIQTALKTIEGVSEVERASQTNGFTAFTVTGTDGIGVGADLCPRIFDLVRDRGWRLAELRPEQQTLESVFRDIVERKLVKHGGQTA